MSFSTNAILLTIIVVVLAAAALGIWLSSRQGTASAILPFSGGILAGIALFWVLPALAERFSFPAAAGWLAAGFALLWFVDRYVYHVCPVCAHTHDHDTCFTRLHGFALPLILAAGLHSFFDGVGIAAAQNAGTGELGRAVFWGIVLHKSPEGVALGVILRASVGSWPAAMLGAAATQLPMLLGGLLGSLLAPRLDSQWLVCLLALAGGGFLYLGFHAVHGGWRQRRAISAFAAACLGAAGGAVIQHLLAGFVH